MPATPAILRQRLRLTALIMLVLGLIAAALIWWTATTDSDAGMVGYDIVGSQSYGSSLSDSRRQSAAVERLGGTAAVLTVEFNQWFSSWWHGKRLAITIAGLSVIVALGCWRIASLVGEDVDS